MRTLSPEGAIEPTGTWNLGTRAGDFVYVVGMRGIDPQTNTIVPEPEGRIRQAFMNMKMIAESVRTAFPPAAARFSNGDRFLMQSLMGGTTAVATTEGTSTLHRLSVFYSITLSA